MKRVLLITFFAMLTQFASSQEFTLSDIYNMAEKNYPLIKKYGIISQTEQFTLSNISKGWLPQVSASAQATYQSDVVALPDALMAAMASSGNKVLGLKKDQYKIGVDVTQAIYDGGAISAQKDIAKVQSQVEMSKNDVDLYSLRDRLNNVFFSLLLVDERLAINNEVQELLKSNRDNVSALVKGGVATESDLESVNAEVLTAIQQQTQLVSQRKALLRVLSIYIGQNVSGVVRPVDKEPSTTMARPEMRMFDNTILLTQMQEKALKTGLMPRLSLFAQGYYGYPGFNMYGDMFSHKWTLNGLAGARLTWNIGALYTNKNDKKKLGMQRMQVENAREVFLFNNNLQSVQESETISGYRKIIADDDNIITLRSSVRKAAESKLAHGIVDINKLVQEITRENQAKINKSTHEIEMLQHIYSLENISGK